VFDCADFALLGARKKVNGLLFKFKQNIANWGFFSTFWVFF
jgi:hypothetical protein